MILESTGGGGGRCLVVLSPVEETQPYWIGGIACKSCSKNCLLIIVRRPRRVRVMQDGLYQDLAGACERVSEVPLLLLRQGYQPLRVC